MKKTFLIPLIGEFIIIVILVVLNINKSSNIKCESDEENKNNNYIYEVNYECISKNEHQDYKYIINKKITTDIKEKITNIKTEHQYIRN